MTWSRNLFSNEKNKLYTIWKSYAIKIGIIQSERNGELIKGKMHLRALFTEKSQKESQDSENSKKGLKTFSGINSLKFNN